MIYGLKTIAAYVLGTDCAGRNLAVYPDDTFVVSYPLWKYLDAISDRQLGLPDKNVGFANIEKLIPDTTAQSSRTLKRTARPRIMKSHEYLNLRYPRTIYIVRDPRDVVLSAYYFQRKYKGIKDDLPLESFVDDFVIGRSDGGWGTWSENVEPLSACRTPDPPVL